MMAKTKDMTPGKERHSRQANFSFYGFLPEKEPQIATAFIFSDKRIAKK